MIQPSQRASVPPATCCPTGRAGTILSKISRTIPGRQQIDRQCFTLLIRHATSRVFNQMANTGRGRGLFGGASGKICAVAAAPTSAEMAVQVRLALRETHTIELRLDWLRSDFERSRSLAVLTQHDCLLST